MVEDQAISLVTNLTATGLATAAGVSAHNARAILRRRRYSEELESVTTEFMQALESAIATENRRRETGELAGVVDDWSAVATTLARDGTGTAPGEPARDSEQLDLLFGDEAEAVERIADAIATVQGYDIQAADEGMREALEAALTRAYRAAIVEFERRLAGTDLADVFDTETSIRLAEQVTDLQRRLAELGADIESVLTQAARDEGFRQLTPSEFTLGPEPRPERSWRIGFTLSDIRAGIPAERLGRRGDEPASAELFATLRDGEDCIVVGGPGSGKSTLCKQVAIRWYEADDTGEVLYRESGAGGGSRFESVRALREAITATDAQTLVVVEDATQPSGSAILEVIENLGGYDGVSFLLDDARQAVEEFDGTGPVESSVRARQVDLVESLRRYHVPRLVSEDVERVVRAFEDATGRTVDRDPAALHREITSRSDAGIGAMILLSFLLPLGDGEAATGLERNVRHRYETLDPTADTAIRNLSRFDDDLLADVGVMVTLLNASGIGIEPELVHALGTEYGHDWETHDEIADILTALEGWFLYTTKHDRGGPPALTTHRLWSTLYLRELALDHEQLQAERRRRVRSNRRFARCLDALFALFEDADERAALAHEFPGSELLDRIEREPTATLEAYLTDLFTIGEEWPALAALVGTTDTATYDLPAAVTDEQRWTVTELRGHTHRLRGNYDRARREYEQALDAAGRGRDRTREARSRNNLGLVAEAAGEMETAETQFEDALELFEAAADLGGQAMCLSNLGVVARKRGDLSGATDWHERGLERFRGTNARYVEAACLGNLGVIAAARGDLPTARDHLRESLAIARNLGDRHAKAEALIGLGLVARHEGNFETAAEYAERSHKIEREIGNRHGEATTLGVRALVTRGQDDPLAARQWYDRALEIAADIGDHHTEATLLGGVAVLEREQGDLRAAREHIERSCNLFRELDDAYALAESRGLRGAIDVTSGRVETGRRRLTEAREDLVAVDAPLTELQVLRHHIEAEHERGDDARVRTLCEAAMDPIDRAPANLGHAQDIVETYRRQVER